MPLDVPKWRNWQTRYVQGVVGATPWEFKSPLRHRRSGGSNATVSDVGQGGRWHRPGARGKSELHRAGCLG